MKTTGTDSLIIRKAGVTPRYDTTHISDADKDGKLSLFLARDGRDKAMTINANADIYAACLHGSQRIEHSVKPDRSAWLQMVRGTLHANDKRLEAGDGLAVAANVDLLLAEAESAEFLLFDLEVV